MFSLTHVPQHRGDVMTRPSFRFSNVMGGDCFYDCFPAQIHKFLLQPTHASAFLLFSDHAKGKAGRILASHHGLHTSHQWPRTHPPHRRRPPHTLPASPPRTRDIQNLPQIPQTRLPDRNRPFPQHCKIRTSHPPTPLRSKRCTSYPTHRKQQQLAIFGNGLGCGEEGEGLAGYAEEVLLE